jgi:hypothetical protein
MPSFAVEIRRTQVGALHPNRMSWVSQGLGRPNADRVEIRGLGGESESHVNSATGNPKAGSQSVGVFIYVTNCNRSIAASFVDDFWRLLNYVGRKKEIPRKSLISLGWLKLSPKFDIELLSLFTKHKIIIMYKKVLAPYHTF